MSTEKSGEKSDLPLSSFDKGPHLAIDINDDAGPSSQVEAKDTVPQEPPPAFAPYEAEFFETEDGDIISHDHHLNEDGKQIISDVNFVIQAFV